VGLAGVVGALGMVAGIPLPGVAGGWAGVAEAGALGAGTGALAAGSGSLTGGLTGGLTAGSVVWASTATGNRHNRAAITLLAFLGEAARRN
jgi:hypothetical protein